MATLPLMEVRHGPGVVFFSVWVMAQALDFGREFLLFFEYTFFRSLASIFDVREKS